MRKERGEEAQSQELCLCVGSSSAPGPGNEEGCWTLVHEELLRLLLSCPSSRRPGTWAGDITRVGVVWVDRGSRLLEAPWGYGGGLGGVELAAAMG